MIGPIDIVAEGYTGLKVYRVTHAKHGGVQVAAPDENAALVCAAKRWGERWQSWDFYTSCLITRSR